MASEPFDLGEYETELDQMQTNVMPESWLGHGRLKIQERGFGGEKRTFANRLLARLGEKFPDADAETLAEKAIDHTEEKF